MTPEIESIKHIGDMVDGKMVCRKDCPSVTHKNTPDTEMCICGEQECLGGAEVELAGVCHRPNNPCYIIDRTTPDTEWSVEELTNEFHSLFSKVSEGDFSKWHDGMVLLQDLTKQKEFIRNKVTQLLTSRDTYWKERVQDVKFDIEALRGSPGDTDLEYARAITDVHKILDILLDNLK